MAFRVLNICVVLPKFQSALCEPTRKIRGDILNNGSINIQDSQYNTDNVGLNIVMKLTERYSRNIGLLRTGLSILVTCTCAPIYVV